MSSEMIYPLGRRGCGHQVELVLVDSKVGALQGELGCTLTNLQGEVLKHTFALHGIKGNSKINEK